MVKILVFGDSIAWGAFDTMHGGWVESLKTYYLRNYIDKGIGVYNLAVSSNDTRGTLESMETDIQKIKSIEPEDFILVFSIGSNDARYFGTRDNTKIPINEFKDNLHKIINIARKYSDKIIFTGLMGVDEKKTMPWTENEYWENAIIKEYDATISEICDEEGIEFIPLIGLIHDDDLHDGLHPNNKGHEKIFLKIKDFLSKELDL